MNEGTRPFKLLIDDEIFFWQKFGGVSRVFTELLKRIKNNPQVELIFKCLYTENEYVLNQHWNSLPPVLRRFHFPGKGKMVRSLAGAYSQARVKKALSRKGEEIVFHPTFISDYYLPLLGDPAKKLVYTVHDLIHEKFPQNELYRKQAGIKLKNIRRADRIITVSEATKQELLSFYPFVDEAKVVVIHLADSLPIATAPINGLPVQYILHTGGRAGYKNFEVLLNAFGRVVNQHPEMELVCTGGGTFSRVEKEIIYSLGIRRKVHIYKLTDRQLRQAYAHAKLFVFPSKYEGFGLPVLEAFHSRTPCVLSNIPVLREVAGDAAIYFDPEDTNELAGKIQEMLMNDHLRLKVANAGMERAEQFSWDRCYLETLAVYQSLITSKS